jgi:photosystem II stability/assembly factor-like uncharacterized protein
MSRILTFAMILGATFLLFLPAAPAQATPNTMKLLTENTGWALMHGRLYWTTDFGQHWRDITPPGAPVPRRGGVVSIADVSFHGTADGWVLLRTGGGGEYGDSSFELASTTDAGTTWSVTPVTLPNWRSWRRLGGNGSVDFVDPLHGWMNLSLESSANFDRGLLYSTADGGRTWQQVPGAPMIAAGVRSVTAKDCWLAGGPAGQDLYATHDGGASWTRLTLKAPPQAGRATLPTYQLPMFVGARLGYVAVFYSGGEGDGTALVLFTTHDGGRTWKAVGLLRDSRDGSGGELVPWAITRTELIATGPGRASLVLKALGFDGRVREPKGAAPGRLGAVAKLSFVGDLRGWVAATQSGMEPGHKLHLYSTTDGGATWNDITPKPTRVSVPRGAITLRMRFQGGATAARASKAGSAGTRKWLDKWGG